MDLNLLRLVDSSRAKPLNKNKSTISHNKNEAITSLNKPAKAWNTYKAISKNIKLKDQTIENDELKRLKLLLLVKVFTLLAVLSYQDVILSSLTASV